MLWDLSYWLDMGFYIQIVILCFTIMIWCTSHTSQLKKDLTDLNENWYAIYFWDSVKGFLYNQTEVIIKDRLTLLHIYYGFICICTICTVYGFICICIIFIILYLFTLIQNSFNVCSVSSYIVKYTHIHTLNFFWLTLDKIWLL